MHVLAISLLALFAGTWLLAKTRKEELGKFFKFISWFFIVVGFAVFIGFLAGGICKMSHHCGQGGQACQQEMRMKECCPGGMTGPGCCPQAEGKSGWMHDGSFTKHDGRMKQCPGMADRDTTKMQPQPKQGE